MYNPFIVKTHIIKCNRLNDNELIIEMEKLKSKLTKLNHLLKTRYKEFDDGKMPYRQFNSKICTLQENIDIISKKLKATENIMNSRGIQL